MIIGSSAVEAGAVADHQQCYAISDSADTVKYTADLTPADPAFPAATGCQIKVPAKLLCIGVAKSNVDPAPPGSGDGPAVTKSLCYKAKCPAGSPVTVSVGDQFGAREVTATKTKLVCAPVPADFCTDASHCETVDNGSMTCTANHCVFGGCDAGYADCNNDLSDGCETSVLDDPDNCNACSHVCSLENVSIDQCSGGQCTVGACATGYSDCNGQSSDGCEIDIATDPSNCGGCAKVCNSNNITSPTCSGGACNGSCNAGFDDCNHSKLIDGCETALNTNSNCGVCGNVCGGATNCIGGVCQ
jgi:hypothetical protein